MLTAEEIENWNAGYAAGFNASASLTRKDHSTGKKA